MSFQLLNHIEKYGVHMFTVNIISSPGHFVKFHKFFQKPIAFFDKLCYNTIGGTEL